MYPGDLLCILVTSVSACQVIGRTSDGFRQGISPFPGMPTMLIHRFSDYPVSSEVRV